MNATWLLGHQASLQFYLFVAAFAGVAVWESFAPLRAPATATPARWINNLALAGIGNAVARLCFPLLGVSFALFVAERGWGLFNLATAPAWLSFAGSILLIDLAQYGMHRAVHAWPPLWRMHKVHHAELDVDCVTAIRHHPLEVLLTSGVDLLVIATLGAPPLAVLAASILGVVTSVFNHGNVSLRPSIERALRLGVVTPDMHRIHHSTLDRECNANFSMVFPWWDRLFRTWCAAPAHEHSQMSLGLTEARTAADVTLPKLLLLPFRRGTGRNLRAAS